MVRLSLPLCLVLTALVGCDSRSSTVAGGQVIVNGDTFADRADAAWAACPSESVSSAAQDLLKKVNTKVAVDVPSALGGVAADPGVVDLHAPELRDLAMGTDENALADKLRESGAKLLIVHRALGPSFDRDRHVLSRLYHHDQLDRFQLARVEEGLFYYLINDQPLRFDAMLADASVRWLRDELSGKNPAPFLPVKPDRGDWTLIVTLRGQGQELAWSYAQGPTIDVVLKEVAVDLEAWHRRNREILGFPRLSRSLGDLTFDIYRVSERALVVPRSEENLADLWEMGLDGAILNGPVGDKKQLAAWPGPVATIRGITTADSFLRSLARDNRWDSIRPWRDSDTTALELIRTLHYREVRGNPVVPMYRGTSLVPLEFVTLSTTKSAIVSAGEWWLANLQPDGTVTYKYWPEDNRFSDEYNHVRHELATWSLWQAWTLDPRPDFLEGAIRAQEWTLRSLVERDGTNFEPWEREFVDASPYKEMIEKEGIAYLTFGNNTKLGSVVVGLFGMVEVARATGDHSNDELMRKFGRYILLSQLPDGKFRAYHVPPGHPSENAKNDIVPGEAALSLVYLYEYFQDPLYLEPLDKFFEYYKPWYSSRAEKKNVRAPWPQYIYDNTTRLDLVQFGPWTVMAANAYTRVRPDRTDVVDFGLEVARWMVESYEYSAERAPFPDYIGGYYKYEGELPAMQAFCYGEGTAAAYSMAVRTRPDQAAYFEKATRETIRFGMQLQHDRLDSYGYARPELVEGGVRYAMNEPKVRQDYTYHAQSTWFQWYLAAKDDPNLPAALRAEPDERLRPYLAAQDLPFFRAPDAPVRTSLPKATTVGALEQAEGVMPGTTSGNFKGAPASPPLKATSGDEDGGE